MALCFVPERAMPATVAKTSRKAAAPVAFRESESLVVIRRGDPDAMRAAVDRIIARARKDRRQGDAAATLREFRDRPRA